MTQTVYITTLSYLNGKYKSKDLDHLKIHFESLTPNERKEFINDLLDEYCHDCYNKHPTNGLCKSWNDE